MPSVIRQKGKSQNGCFKKTKHVKFSEKQIFLTPWYTRVSGGKKNLFFGKFDVLCFLETPVLRFTLLPYYRQYVNRLKLHLHVSPIFSLIGLPPYFTACLKSCKQHLHQKFILNLTFDFVLVIAWIRVRLTINLTSGN